MSTTDPRLTSGVAALKAGDQTTGASQLASLLHDDPTNGYAWLWYSTTLASDATKRYCLERVLEYGPGSIKESAKNGLKKLSAVPSVTPFPLAVDLPNVAQIVAIPPVPAKKGIGCGSAVVLTLVVVGGLLWFLMFLGRPVQTTQSVPSYAPKVSGLSSSYIASVRGSLATISNGLTTMADLLDKPQLASDTWRDQLDESLAQIRKGHTDLLTLEPPAEAEAFHRELTNATQDCYQATFQVSNGLDASNKALLNDASHLIQSCASKSETLALQLQK